MSDVAEALRVAESLKPAERLRLIAHLWESLSPENWLTPDDSLVSSVKERWAKYGSGDGDYVPWPIVEQMLADCARARRPKIYSAPRRYDLFTLFVVTTAYATLFGIMSGLQFGPPTMVMVAGFITFVGIGQAALYHGRRPRAASVAVGTTVLLLACVGYWLVYRPMAPGPSTILMMIVPVAIYGVVLGYLAGVMVGGVFLVTDVLRRRFRRPAATNELDSIAHG